MLCGPNIKGFSAILLTTRKFNHSEEVSNQIMRQFILTMYSYLCGFPKQGECQTGQNLIVNQRRPNQILDSPMENYQLEKNCILKHFTNEKSSPFRKEYMIKTTCTQACRRGMCVMGLWVVCFCIDLVFLYIKDGFTHTCTNNTCPIFS